MGCLLYLNVVAWRSSQGSPVSLLSCIVHICCSKKAIWSVIVERVEHLTDATICLVTHRA